MKRAAETKSAVKRERDDKKARATEPCIEGARTALAQMIIDIGIAGLPSRDEVCEKVCWARLAS